MTNTSARLAVPLFGDEVAPRFCFAEEVLLADVEAGAVKATQRLSMGDAPWAQRLAELGAAGVTVLLCGGFNRRFLPLAVRHQMQVIWGLVGPASLLIEAYCNGQLDGFRLCAGAGPGTGPSWGAPLEPAPGWRGGGRQRRRGGGSGRGRGRGRGGPRQ